MYLRSAPTLTLSDVMDDVSQDPIPDSDDIDIREIRVDIIEENSIALSDVAVVPASTEGLEVLSDALDIPFKFLQRLPVDLQQHLMMAMLQQATGIARVEYNDRGLKGIYSPKQSVIRTRDIVETVMRVMHPEAWVVDWWNNPKEFRLDVVVSPESDRGGIGGDAQVGDLTHGGIRIIQDRKKNLAPYVGQYLYRLACTNGMEVMSEGLKIEARGNTVDEVLASLEEVADRAFRRVESTIESFYDTRRIKVQNPERDILRYAEEAGLSDRLTTGVAERVPAVFENDVSLFDIVNLITNHANAEGVKDGPRRSLEQLGGNLVSEHVERCSHCRGRLI